MPSGDSGLAPGVSTRRVNGSRIVESSCVATLVSRNSESLIAYDQVSVARFSSRLQSQGVNSSPKFWLMLTLSIGASTPVSCN